MQLKDYDDKSFTTVDENGDEIEHALTSETQPFFNALKQHADPVIDPQTPPLPQGDMNADANTAPPASDLTKISTDRRQPVSPAAFDAFKGGSASAATASPSDVTAAGNAGLTPGQTARSANQDGAVTNPVEVAADAIPNTATETKNTTTVISPDALKSARSANDALMEAYKHDAEAKANSAMAVSEEMKRQAAEQKAASDALALKQAKDASMVREKYDQLNEIGKKYAGAKIDAGHIWGDEGTGNRILAAIGMGLGAVGVAYGGGDNPAIGIIERAIDRDIDVQKANIDKMGRNLEVQRGALADYQRILGDENAAKSAEYARQLDIARAKIEQIKQSNLPAEIKTNAEVLGKSLEQKVSEKMMDVNRTVHEEVHKQKTAPALKLTPAQIDNVHSKQQAIKSLDQLVQAQNVIADSTGPLEGRWKVASQKLGWNTPDEDAFMQRLAELQADVTKAKFNRVTEKELFFIGDKVTPKMSSANVKERLQALREDAANQYNDYLNLLQNSAAGVAPKEVLTNANRPKKKLQ
jgi:hypothetical protein